MRSMRLFCYVCALAGPLFVTPAEAWDGDWYTGWGRGFVPSSVWFYHSETVPTPPYFAIHPPVYYGPQLALTYGPVLLPQVLGRMGWNPHGTPNPAAVVHGPQVQVQVIENPFYVPPPGAKPKRPRPAPAAARR